MATRTQFRRGTSAQHDTFIGAPGEVTVDTTHNTLRIHDGAFAGGRETVLEQKFRRHDLNNAEIIFSNYTNGFFTNVSKNLFQHAIAKWYWRNQDADNTYLTRADWKNAIYCCFTSFLSGPSDVSLDTLTEGVA